MYVVKIKLQGCYSRTAHSSKKLAAGIGVGGGIA